MNAATTVYSVKILFLLRSRPGNFLLSCRLGFFGLPKRLTLTILKTVLKQNITVQEETTCPR